MRACLSYSNSVHVRARLGRLSNDRSITPTLVRPSSLSFFILPRLSRQLDS